MKTQATKTPQEIAHNAFTRGLAMVDKFDRDNKTNLGPRLRRELCDVLGGFQIMEIDGRSVHIPTPYTRQCLNQYQRGKFVHKDFQRKIIEQTFKAYIGTTDIWGLA